MSGVVGLSLAPELEPLAKLLRERKLSVAVAESCTAGLLGACLADLPGASGYFLGGFITYATDTKASQLGVPDEVLSREGAVSAEVAGAMAERAAREMGADLALSITGVAGPETQEGKPVGLTYVGGWLRGRSQVEEHHFSGGRASNRLLAVEAALNLARRLLERPG